MVWKYEMENILFFEKYNISSDFILFYWKIMLK